MSDAAAVEVPWVVDSALVVLSLAPAVKSVTLTTMTQLPDAGIV